MLWTSCALFSFLGPLIAGKIEQAFGLDAVGYWAASSFLVASALQILTSLTMANKKLEMVSAERIPLRN